MSETVLDIELCFAIVFLNDFFPLNAISNRILLPFIYSDKKKHQDNKRSPSYERHQSKRFRRDSEKSTHDRHKSRKTIAEQNAEVDEEIR